MDTAPENVATDSAPVENGKPPIARDRRGYQVLAQNRENEGWEVLNSGLTKRYAQRWIDDSLMFIQRFYKRIRIVRTILVKEYDL